MCSAAKALDYVVLGGIILVSVLSMQLRRYLLLRLKCLFISIGKKLISSFSLLSSTYLMHLLN
jgi:hypothetical protein